MITFISTFIIILLKVFALFGFVGVCGWLLSKLPHTYIE